LVSKKKTFAVKAHAYSVDGVVSATNIGQNSKNPTIRAYNDRTGSISTSATLVETAIWMRSWTVMSSQIIREIRIPEVTRLEAKKIRVIE
jgi:hypothetical protein